MGTYYRKNAASKENKYYSILVNEATDCAMKEQMVLILRFVDKNDIIREELYVF